MQPTTIHPELLSLTADQFRALIPFFWLCGGTVLAILASTIKSVLPKWPVFFVVLTTIAVGIASSLGLLADGQVLLFNRMMISDGYSNFFSIIFLVAALMTTLSSFRYLDPDFSSK